MEVKEITYLRRFNLGNYQHEDIGMTISLAPSDMPGDAIKYASSVVELSTAQSREVSQVLDAKNRKELTTLTKEGLI